MDGGACQRREGNYCLGVEEMLLALDDQSDNGTGMWVFQGQNQEAVLASINSDGR